MVRIITDSTCDLSKSRQVELGVEVAPLSVHFGAETFRDGVDLTNGDFYARLRRAEALPTTSQVNPEDFAARFRACREAGDEVVGIFISSLLSGTCQSACIARDMVEDTHIFVVDSGTVTFGLGLLVERAAFLRDQGLSAGEIASEVERLSREAAVLRRGGDPQISQNGRAHFRRHRRCGRDAGDHADPEHSGRCGRGSRKVRGRQGRLPVDGGTD